MNPESNESEMQLWTTVVCYFECSMYVPAWYGGCGVDVESIMFVDAQVGRTGGLHTREKSGKKPAKSQGKNQRKIRPKTSKMPGRKECHWDSKRLCREGITYVSGGKLFFDVRHIGVYDTQ